MREIYILGPKNWRLIVDTAGKNSRFIEDLYTYENKARLLAGDLRRLETDTVDERATCLYISQKTGIDVNAVAAVLAEFIKW